MKLRNILNIYGMKRRMSLFVYGLLCNLPVCVALCFTSTFIAIAKIESGSLVFKTDAINWGIFFINFGIAFIIAMTIELTVPLIPIGKWFTAKCGVDNVTFKGNPKYRLLATLATSFIFFIIITPVLNVLNCYIYPLIRGLEPYSFVDGLINFAINVPFMYIIGYLTSLIFDFPAFKVAHKIDDTF